MRPVLSIKPIAMEQVAVRVERSKKLVWYRDLPRVIRDVLPVFDGFGSRNDDGISMGGLIGNAFCCRRAAPWRGNTFAVHAFVDGDDIAGLGKIRRALDAAKWGLDRARGRVSAACGDMDF